MASLLLQFKQIKRAFQIDIPGRDDVEIDGCGFYGGVTEKLADGVEIVSLV
jgi:hypothetical protein